MAICPSQPRPDGTSILFRLCFLPILAAVLLHPSPAGAQKSDPLPMDPSAVHMPKLKDHFLRDPLPEKPTVAPSTSIPVDPFDFAAPNPVYIGHRYVMASLDFLDENHLLFTFRVPGLIRRVPGQPIDENEHQMRAVLLSLPSGTIDAQTTWTIHDRAPFIWALKDGHFFLRNRNLLSVGDASLHLKPFLRFPGPLLTVSLDPTQQYLVTNSREPVKKTATSGDSSNASSASASNTGSDDNDQSSGNQPDLVLRIFHRNSGQVMDVGRIRTPVRLPVNSQGFLQSLRGKNSTWVVQMNYFKGGNSNLARIKSACRPTFHFVSDDEFLATACTDVGGFWLNAISTTGKYLWQDSTSGYTVWPILRTSASGLRFLRETLAVRRQLSTIWGLDRDDIVAQRVRVFDAATGNIALEATADPVLDAGGNAAISPSGRRVAILSGGAIQIFNLPKPPPLPKAATNPD